RTADCGVPGGGTCGGLRGAGVGRWCDAAAARAGVVRGDAGGLASPAAQPPVEQFSDRGPGTDRAPVRRVRRLAVAVVAYAGRGLVRRWWVGAFDGAFLSGRVGGLSRLCLRSSL